MSADALRAAADEIERELICCDEYEMPDEARRHHVIRHDICYWSSAARAIVLEHADRADRGEVTQ